MASDAGPAIPPAAGRVLLLHGVLRGAGSMARMERSLRAVGHGVLNLGYASRRRPLEALADDVAAATAGFVDGPGPVHVVAHSMGGLLARTWIARHRPRALGRVVVIGTPSGGSEVADLLCGNPLSRPLYQRVFGPAGLQLTTRPIPVPGPGSAPDETPGWGPLDYELGAIAGNRTLAPVASWLVLPRPNDGRVSVASTRVEGMADHLVLPVNHTLMMRDPAVIEQTLHFLRHGRFRRAAA